MLPGTYEGVRGGVNSYSDADLDAAVSAYHELKGVFTPKAKIGHNTDQKLLAADELPSAGDFTNMYRRGKCLVVDVAGVPARLAQLIKAGAYGPRSAELMLNTEIGGKVYPLVVKGFAWLGATAPAVAGLADIVALYALPETGSTYTDADGRTVTVIQLAGNHAPFSGHHAHPHPALGAQGDDATHAHDHQHDGDANHDHHAAAMADAPTQTEDGTAFPKSDYAYTPDDTPSNWKLRLTSTPGGNPDPAMVAAAAAALGSGYRGQRVQLPGADRPAVVAKVRAAWKKANPDKAEDEMPPALRTEAKHSRGPLAFLARLVGLAAADPGELTDADLAQQAITIIEQLVVREAQEQLSGEDEDDDIRTLLMCRDMLQRFAQGELMEGIGVESGSSDMYAAYAMPDGDERGTGLLAALEAVKTHLDGLGKGRRGVGMARVAHRLLTGYAKTLLAQWQNPDTAGNTDPTEGPEGERGNELKGGVPVQHSRQEETVNDTELRGLLGLAPDADITAAVIALKAGTVALAQHEALEAQVAALAQKDAEREALLLVEQGIDSHKVNPAMRAWAHDQALHHRASFEAYLAAAPATAWPAGEIGSGGDNHQAPQPLSTSTLQIMQVMGVSPQAAQAGAEKPFAVRVLEAKQQALANAGKSLARRA